MTDSTTTSMDDDISLKFWNESNRELDSCFVIYLSLLALVLILGKFLHDHPKLSSIIPEALMVMVIGIVAGCIIHAISTPLADSTNDDYDDASSNTKNDVADGLLSFSPKVFFFILLPPIIFNSGYHLRRNVFFRHITPIVLFACVGTAISTFTIAILLQIIKKIGWIDNNNDFQPHFTELLTFGAILSATDPVSTLAVFQAKQVDPHLFYLVFGESVLNDAVGITLFNTLSKFIGKKDDASQIVLAIFDFLLDFGISFVGSMSLGWLAGIIPGFYFKKVDMGSTPTLELSLFFLIVYIPFFVAELLNLSGIVTILFTGIAAKRYVTQNLSNGTEEKIDSLFKVSAHLAETSIFLDLGLSVFGLSSVGPSVWKFIAWSLIACLIGRALNIYPLRAVYNRFLLPKDTTAPTTPENDSDAVMEKEMNSSPTKFRRMGFDRELSTPLESSSSTQPSESNSPHSNKFKHVARDLMISNNKAHMLWFSGLRGAVAYACAKSFPDYYGNRDEFVFTTMMIILFTVFVFGCTTELALNYLNIEMGVDEDKYMIETDSDDQNTNFINELELKYINTYVIRERQDEPQTHNSTHDVI